MWWRSLGLDNLNAFVVALILLTAISLVLSLFVVLFNRYRHRIIYALIGLVFFLWIFSSFR